MIVVRRTLQVKEGADNKLLALIKSWPDLGLPSPPHGVRVYTYGKASPWGIVIWEQDFESLAEQAAFMKEYFAHPSAGEETDKFMELVESRGSTTEYWRMEQIQ